MRRVEVSPGAMRAIRGLDPRTRERIAATLHRLAESSRELDIKPLQGRNPWLRLRVGTYRVLLRPLGHGEPGPGFLVAHVVHRRDLERAVRRL